MLKNVNLQLAEGGRNLRKARGAFFTPTAVSAFITRWAVRKSTDRVLEPSCGEAAFLLEVGARLWELGLRERIASQLHGIEIHGPSAGQARKRLESSGLEAQITVGDFFDFADNAKYDAVVGNPPYIRYQDFAGTARLKALKAASAQDVSLTKLASSWAAFTVHAAGFLKPDGRLGLVLPAELLSVNYAAPVRAFLLRRFSRIRLVLFRERIFPGVSEEVVLLLAEGRGPIQHFEVFHAGKLADIEDREAISWALVPIDFDGKWSIALLRGEASDSYDRLAGDVKSFVPLLHWGDPTLGMVTGNNKYFTLTRDQARSWGLGEDELLTISPPGSRHLRGLSFSLQDWQRLCDIGQPVFLFRPLADRLSSAAEAFVKAGEEEGIQEAYKCRVRRPWWRVPLVPAPHLFLTYMNHDAPRLVANGAGARHLNSVHGLRLREGARSLGVELLPLAMLNSVTLLGAELVGRSYGGGILKVEPKEADRLPVPSAALLGSLRSPLRNLLDNAAELLLERKLDDVVDLVDELLLVHGLELPATELRRLQQARQELFSRRTARH